MHSLSKRNVLAVAILVLTAICIGSPAAAEPMSPVPGKRVALSGYDPVAYFTVGRPEKGSSEFWFAFDDAVYLFASGEHRATFAKDPVRYAPQYDGFCTMALTTLGTKLEPDPHAWAIHDGKLYVFGKPAGRGMFKDDPGGYVEKAEARWPAVRAVPSTCRLVDPTQPGMAMDCKDR